MVSDLNIFVWKWSKIAKLTKLVFLVDFALQNMVETTLPDGLETSGQRVYRKFWHISRHFWVFAFWMIFSVLQKNGVFGYSWSTLLRYRCYYPHRSRDALSPVCGIFILTLKGEITSACLELKGLLSLRDKYRSRVHLTLRAESTAMALSHWAYWVRTWPARVLYSGTVQRVQKM